MGKGEKKGEGGSSRQRKETHARTHVHTHALRGERGPKTKGFAVQVKI